MLEKNSLIGVATRRDLTDVTYGRTWYDLSLDPRERIDSYFHPDGTKRFVFQVHGLYIVVAERSLAA